MKRENKRFILYVFVGGYLMYLAYQMYQNPDGNARSTVITAFMILFLVIGIVLVIYGGWLFYQNIKQMQQGDAEQASDEATEQVEASEQASDEASGQTEDEASGYAEAPEKVQKDETTR